MSSEHSVAALEVTGLKHKQVNLVENNDVILKLHGLVCSTTVHHYVLRHTRMSQVLPVRMALASWKAVQPSISSGSSQP